MKLDADSVIKCHIRIMQNKDDNYFMEEALKEAKKAYKKGEVPVGCVIVYNNEIIARAHNTRHQNKSAIDHAEMKAIKKANKKLNAWMLDDAVLYVTLEPCLMCAGAIFQSRIKRVVFGAFDKKAGSCSHESVIDLFSLPYNHRPEVWAGIMEKECSEVLTEFFENLREKDK